jgi:hypothetical protein
VVTVRRLTNDLGYAKTHPFELKKTGGGTIYHMIFATDNAAGDRIIGDRVVETAGVRRPQHGPDTLAKRLIVGLGLAHEVVQRAFADDRKQRHTNRLVGMLDRGLSETKKNALLTDAMHKRDEQINERVGDLRRPRPAQRRQQRQPDRLARGTQI